MRRLSLDIDLKSSNGVLVTSFLNAIEDAVGILKDIDRDIAQARKPSLIWTIERISMQSPLKVVLRGDPRSQSDSSHEVVTACVDGLHFLENGLEKLPPHFPTSTLDKLMGLVNLSNDGIASITLGLPDEPERPLAAVQISDSIARNVKTIIRGKYTRAATFDGVLDFVNYHKNPPEVRIYDVITKRAVKCEVPERLFGKVRSSLRDRVKIYGEASYTIDNKPIKVAVDEIEALPAPLPAARLQSLLASLRDIDITGGMSAGEYVRWLRDG